MNIGWTSKNKRALAQIQLTPTERAFEASRQEQAEREQRVRRPRLQWQDRKLAWERA